MFWTWTAYIVFLALNVYLGFRVFAKLRQGFYEVLLSIFLFLGAFCAFTSLTGVVANFGYMVKAVWLYVSLSIGFYFVAFLLWLTHFLCLRRARITTLALLALCLLALTCGEKRTDTWYRARGVCDTNNKSVGEFACYRYIVKQKDDGVGWWCGKDLNQAGSTCRPPSVCEENGHCNDEGRCVGTPRSCDDSNPCTKDRCEETMLGAYYSPEYESGKVCLNKICYTDVQPVCRHDNAPDREVCLGLGTCMAGRCVYEEKDGTLKVLHKPVPESFSCKSASDCPM